MVFPASCLVFSSSPQAGCKPDMENCREQGDFSKVYQQPELLQGQDLECWEEGEGVGALPVTLIPFPCAGGAAGNTLPTAGGAAPQLLPHRLPGQKRAWWDSTKSCSARGEL